jgi:hypothetical protein
LFAVARTMNCTELTLAVWAKEKFWAIAMSGWATTFVSERRTLLAESRRMRSKRVTS